MPFTSTPIKQLYAAQPFQYRDFIYLSLFIFVVSVICGSLIFTESDLAIAAFNLLSEQLAPTGIQTFCSIGLLYFTIKIIKDGPIKKYNSGITKYFVYISKFGLSLLFTYSAIAAGLLTSIIMVSYTPPEQFSINIIMKSTAIIIFITHIFFAFFISLMANDDHVPNFKKPKFILTYKILCALFLFVLIPRSILALYLAAIQN